MRDIFLLPEASNRYNVILRVPFFLPFSTSSADWFWVFNQQVPPVLGNAGSDQQISNELVQAESDFCFNFSFDALLGFGLDIVFFGVGESSLLSLASIVGREGGSVQFLGSQLDTLYLTFMGRRGDVDVLLTLPEKHNVRFTRYDEVWWEGEASIVGFADPVLEAVSKLGLVSVTVALRGKQMATTGPAIGMLDFIAEQEVLNDLMFNEADWDFRFALGTFDFNSYYNFNWWGPFLFSLSENISLADAVRCGFQSGWSYRKSHVVGYAAGAGVNYQKRVTVHYGGGTDGGEDVYCGGKCKADFGDVRFTGGDGLTLDYWLESKVDGDYAVFWVEVADSLESAAKTIYVYYGNAAAATISNGIDTFPLFNGASITGWDQTYRHPDEYYGPATVAVEADYLKASGTHGYEVNVYFSKVLSVTSGQGYMLRTYRVTAVSTDSGVEVTPICGLYYANGVAAGNIVGASWTKLFSMTSDYTWYSGTFTAPSATITISEQSLQHAVTGQPYPQVIDHRFRNILLRKYVSPEPCDGAWGSEEQLN